jgi:hypothetical protein
MMVMAPLMGWAVDRVVANRLGGPLGLVGFVALEFALVSAVIGSN